MNKTFYDHGIDTKGKISGQVKIPCPKCSHTRKKKYDPCLSVNIDDEVWNCWHCEWSGGLKNGNVHNGNGYKPRQVNKPQYSTESGLSAKVRAYFNGRGITDKVLDRNKITDGPEWMPQTQKEVNAIRFPYFKDGEVINVKYRDGEKNFKMVKDAERTLYGFDYIEGDTLIWCEGEIDKLSCEVAGFPNSVSVPNGASDKLDFLGRCEKKLEAVSQHILALDNDAPGKKLEAELIRRLGPEKCKVGEWPINSKDANDVLVKYGSEKLKACIESARPCPISGLYEVRDIIEDVLGLYDNGAQGGAKVGWLNLERLYSVRSGEWTLITGIPSHGKSEVLDAMLIDLAESEGWSFGICSPENQPLQRHAAKLLEKYLGKPFRSGPSERIQKNELMPGLGWLDKHFSFILPDENDLTVDGVLKLARALVFRKGIRGLVVDPWNELDHSRPSNLSETEYISQALTKIRRFARTYDVHVWLVAHPTKLPKQTDGKYPVPTPYDVSGSAHWRNKADNCLAVWRDLSEPHSREVQVHVQKIRFKEVGQIGMAKLNYDILTGRYRDAS
ncbi:MAG: toprim domain-containing protein [Nitrospina sp.]|jgi:twinkle protein|nr:toprim domain-containing protein [Nitrospina sp.]MBT6717595.1 toprim domain-containing protein [Nitrospina sp.]